MKTKEQVYEEYYGNEIFRIRGKYLDIWITDKSQDDGKDLTLHTADGSTWQSQGLSKVEASQLAVALGARHDLERIETKLDTIIKTMAADVGIPEDCITR